MCKLKSFYYVLQSWTVVLSFNYSYGLGKFDKKELEGLREEVREMFHHAYEGYLNYAYPFDELRPLSCDGVDTWGSYSLTLIDALDTLAVMGNYSEFQRVVNIVTAHANFDANINVSVFETNIRIIGGLLSAHLLSHKAGVNVVPGWPCNGPLLELAEDVARRLIAAFDTPTGMPYGTVNLQHGVPLGETTITCTAGVGTFILELGTLSRLTGDPLFEQVALTALDALYAHRSPLGLVGNHVDVATGRWTAQDAGIGAGVDSYYEYLAKGAILLQRPELMHMFLEGKAAIEKYLKRDDWHLWVSMSKGQVTLPVFQSLEAYWPGVLSLIGDSNKGIKSLHNYHQVWKQYGFTPEFYYIPQGEAGTNRESYPLRPELIESVMYLYRITGDPFLIEVGRDILRSIQHSAKTPCGYATIKDVRDHRKEDRMESFFLAETTKYLYLLFDPENFLHNQGQSGTIIQTPWGECVVDAGGYIFNTEAHPIDPGALHCCSGHRQTEVEEDFNDFHGFNDFKGIPLPKHQKTRQNPGNKAAQDCKLDPSQCTSTKSEEEHNLNENPDLTSKAQIATLADPMQKTQDNLLGTNEASQSSDLSHDDQDSSVEDSSQDLNIDISGSTNEGHGKVSDDDDGDEDYDDDDDDDDDDEVSIFTVNDINETNKHESVPKSDSKSSIKGPDEQRDLSGILNTLLERISEYCKRYSITKCLETIDMKQNDGDLHLQALPQRLKINLDKFKSSGNEIDKKNHWSLLTPKEAKIHHNLLKLLKDKKFYNEIPDTKIRKLLMLLEQVLNTLGGEGLLEKVMNEAEKRDLRLDKSEGLSPDGTSSDTITYQADDSDQVFSSENSNRQQLGDFHDSVGSVESISHSIVSVEDPKSSGDKVMLMEKSFTWSETSSPLEEECARDTGQESARGQIQAPRPAKVKTKFDPQILFERLQNDNRYERNITWLKDYKLLSCSAQPFLQRLSMLGEMFEFP